MGSLRVLQDLPLTLDFIVTHPRHFSKPHHPQCTTWNHSPVWACCCIVSRWTHLAAWLSSWYSAVELMAFFSRSSNNTHTLDTAVRQVTQSILFPRGESFRRANKHFKLNLHVHKFILSSNLHYILILWCLNVHAANLCVNTNTEARHPLIVVSRSMVSASCMDALLLTNLFSATAWPVWRCTVLL